MIKALTFVGSLAATQVAAAQTDSVQIFAKGQISRPDSGESFGTLSPNGREFFYTIHTKDWSKHRIVVSRLENGKWSPPATLPFSGTYNDREPKLTPDGKRMYFSSNRPARPGDPGPARALDLWMAERTSESAWGDPHRIEAPVNTDAQEFCPSVAGNGTLYFISTRPGGIAGPNPRQLHNVWKAKPLDKSGLRFATPENLGKTINLGYETNVYISPDERTMLVSRDGAPDGLGGDDLYMSTFADGAWAPMRHLPAPINSKEYEYGPHISPDGQWLFFTSARAGGIADIYRVPIAALQRDGVKRAVLDYLEGFYEGDTAKLVRSLRPELFKYGFWKEKDSTSYAGEKMSYEEAIGYARRFKANKRTTPDTAPREVTLFDVQDQTASAKVRAWWGTDYILLGKYDGRWMISHVLWQGP